jgi:hypothetical protein
LLFGKNRVVCKWAHPHLDYIAQMTVIRKKSDETSWNVPLGKDKIVHNELFTNEVDKMILTVGTIHEGRKERGETQVGFGKSLRTLLPSHMKKKVSN